jgi:hypothetical protein
MCSFCFTETTDFEEEHPVQSAAKARIQVREKKTGNFQIGLFIEFMRLSVCPTVVRVCAITEVISAIKWNESSGSSTGERRFGGIFPLAPLFYINEEKGESGEASRLLCAIVTRHLQQVGSSMESTHIPDSAYHEAREEKQAMLGVDLDGTKRNGAQVESSGQSMQHLWPAAAREVGITAKMPAFQKGAAGETGAAPCAMLTLTRTGGIS